MYPASPRRIRPLPPRTAARPHVHRHAAGRVGSIPRLPWAAALDDRAPGRQGHCPRSPRHPLDCSDLEREAAAPEADGNAQRAAVLGAEELGGSPPLRPVDAPRGPLCGRAGGRGGGRGARLSAGVVVMEELAGRVGGGGRLVLAGDVSGRSGGVRDDHGGEKDEERAGTAARLTERLDVPGGEETAQPARVEGIIH
eukprot:747603-Hanusia_phi.AAC.1